MQDPSNPNMPMIKQPTNITINRVGALADIGELIGSEFD
jgi:hypothetical protein